MNVQGEKSFAQPRSVVWEVLNDPSRMAKTMPGVESFDIKDERNWTANVKIPLGLGGLKMKINFEKTDERELEYAKLHAKGQGVGALMDMTTQFHLSDEGAGTAMRWEAEVKIAGPVGAMGQRVLQPIVNHQVKNVLASLEREVDAAAVGSDAATPPQTSSSGGGSAGAPAPSTEAEVSTDPELKDYGSPGSPSPDPDPGSVEGSSGAEEGLNPWSSESYTEDPQGPTTTPERSE